MYTLQSTISRINRAFFHPSLYSIVNQSKNDILGKYFHKTSCNESSKNYYDVLGVTPQSSNSQIKTAYYKLSKMYHPDVNSTDEAKILFGEISEAYSILGNIQSRHRYNRTIHGRNKSGTSTVVDKEYEIFIRKKGKFKSRPGIRTGQTDFYNFNEFNKMHYSNIRKKVNLSEQFLEEVKEAERHLKMNFTISAIVFLTLVAIFLSHLV